MYFLVPIQLRLSLCMSIDLSDVVQDQKRGNHTTFYPHLPPTSQGKKKGRFRVSLWRICTPALRRNQLLSLESPGTLWAAQGWSVCRGVWCPSDSFCLRGRRETICVDALKLSFFFWLERVGCHPEVRWGFLCSCGRYGAMSIGAFFRPSSFAFSFADSKIF